MIVLRLFWLATTSIAVVLLLGGAGVLAYQETFWLRHNIWPDLRFVQFWQWARIDSSAIGRLVGQRTGLWILQLPLWVGLVSPGIIIGFIAARCGRWLRRTAASR